MPTMTDRDLLVGLTTGDDAAVYRINSDLALIQTVDFFPPIVDDPFTFGEIAVANAVSDVYAMGGTPLLGLNIVGLPIDLPKIILGNILRGGASKAQEAGMIIIGGHTMNDKEPKYGVAVTGVMKPGMQITNAGARQGDILVLTKPIGTGVITTAGKQQRVSDDVLHGAIQTMKTLNHAASDTMVRVGVNSCVDVTGFGLVGHLLGLIEASDVSAKITLESVPLLDGALKLVEQGIVPEGTRRNLNSSDRLVAWDATIDSPAQLLLCDAQTSGGLLMTVPPERLKQLLRELEVSDVETTAVIGEIVEKGSPNDARLEVRS